MSALNKAAKAVLREALDAVDVHPCDVHDDAVRAKGLCGPMADLYAAAIALPVAAGSVDAPEFHRLVCMYGKWRVESDYAALVSRINAWGARLMADAHEQGYFKAKSEDDDRACNLIAQLGYERKCAEKAEARVKELEVRMLSSASGRQTMPT